MSVIAEFKRLESYVSEHIIGQSHFINRLLVSLLCDGHILVEGPPGVAKTKAIFLLSQALACDFQRIQFTPDLLPSDITGTEVFHAKEGGFAFQAGPIFHNLILADEINRAPAKVQSALLEAMSERQVTVGRTTHPLASMFLVMATQNPLEQEGTYPLPEAQLDRFLLHVIVDYPSIEAERQIIRLARQEAKDKKAALKPLEPKVSQETVVQARNEVLGLYMSDAIEEYIIQLVNATRDPRRFSDHFANMIEYGASPRATLALDRCARAHAWLLGKEYVGPEDVQAVACDVLRHRIRLSYEAEANGLKPETFIQQLMEKVAVP